MKSCTHNKRYGYINEIVCIQTLRQYVVEFVDVQHPTAKLILGSPAAT